MIAVFLVALVGLSSAVIVASKAQDSAEKIEREVRAELGDGDDYRPKIMPYVPLTSDKSADWEDLNRDRSRPGKKGCTTTKAWVCEEEGKCERVEKTICFEK